MRLTDLSDGSIKTLLILGLLIANLIVASLSHSRHVAAPRVRSEMTNSE